MTDTQFPFQAYGYMVVSIDILGLSSTLWPPLTNFPRLYAEYSKPGVKKLGGLQGVAGTEDGYSVCCYIMTWSMLSCAPYVFMFYLRCSVGVLTCFSGVGKYGSYHGTGGSLVQGRRPRFIVARVRHHGDS